MASPLNLEVVASEDDARERELDSTGVVVLDDNIIACTSSTLNYQRYWLGWRYVLGETIPQGSTITALYGEWYTHAAWTANDDANFRIYLEKVAAPVSFTTDLGNISSRARTDTYVDWIEDGVVAGGGGYFGSDKSLVTPGQELVNAYSITALVIIFKPYSDTLKDLYQKAYDYGSDPPKLHIAWTEGGVAHTKSLSDNVAISDSISKAVGAVKTDSVVLADALGKASSLVKTDNMALADAIIKTPNLVKSNGVALADDLVKATGLVKSEAVAIADEIDKEVGLYKAESVTITDAVSKAVGLEKVEAVTIADSISKTVSMAKADAVAIIDGLGKAISLVQSDVVTIVDSGIVRCGHLTRLLISRMDTFRLTISRMAYKRIDISRLPLGKFITRRFP